AIWAGGWDWLTLILIPIFVSIAHQLVELIVRQYVEGKRSAVRSRKMTIVSQTVSGPLAEWLIKWPASGGSAYEKLQAALRRVPESIAQLRRLAEPHLRACPTPHRPQSRSCAGFRRCCMRLSGTCAPGSTARIGSRCR